MKSPLLHSRFCMKPWIKLSFPLQNK